MASKQYKSLKAKYEKLELTNAKNCNDYNDLVEQFNELTAEHKELLEKYRATLSTSSGKKKSSEEKNEFMVQQIFTCMKRIRWRVVKFVGNDQQLMDCAFGCLDHLNIKEYTHKDGENEEEIDRKRDEWVALYGTDVRAAINEQRSYVQSEQKKLALARLKGNEKLSIEPQDLPTIEEMWKVVTRDIESDDENVTKKNEELFDWWLDHVGACAGNTYFGKKVRRTQNISTAVNQMDGKLCVPPSTEAMAFLMYENCRQKWIEHHLYREVEGNTGDIPKYSKKHPETHRFKALYSDSNSGQSPYGGWDSAGIKRFNELKKAIGDLRKSNPEHLAEVESAAVQRLHNKAVEERKKKLQINGQDVPADDSAVLPSRKKRKVAKAPMELTVNDEE